MFGVLIVKKESGQLGYLTAFSGKLAGKNSHKRFVPPIYDMLKQEGFFLSASEEINDINQNIEILENAHDYLICIANIDQQKLIAQSEIIETKDSNRIHKAQRKQKRIESKNKLSEKEYSQLLKQLSIESVQKKNDLKKLQQEWNDKISILEVKKKSYENGIESLKSKRKELSLKLQTWLFNQYQFLNQKGETKSLLDIFSTTSSKVPPAGAGECAAPKLINYAFQNNLTPICMTEFWWGESLSEVRRHGHFYPACTGKCKPILNHMLEGIEMDPNPMIEYQDEIKKIEIVYDDPYLAIIHKPAELLSVPGKSITDSVFTRVKDLFPEATGPLIVHRLDMATSGIMIIPKSKEIYKYIQRQFIKRTIHKKYVAILDGILKDNGGIVNLPLRVDLDDRPRQLVCYDHGKPSETRWNTISQDGKTTRVNFYPLTGRTHQLRVHAAHHLGLKTPIVGDDLYGNRGERLLLHAESITFKHPKSKIELTFTVDPDF